MKIIYVRSIELSCAERKEVSQKIEADINTNENKRSTLKLSSKFIDFFTFFLILTSNDASKILLAKWQQQGLFNSHCIVV